MTGTLREAVVLAWIVAGPLLFQAGCSSTRSGSSSGGSSSGGGCSSGCCRSQGPDPAGHDQDRQEGTAMAYGGQRTCPVTGEPLGSMGAAVPVTVEGQTIHVCCEGCVAEVRKNPDAVLPKVLAERDSH